MSDRFVILLELGWIDIDTLEEGVDFFSDSTFPPVGSSLVATYDPILDPDTLPQFTEELFVAGSTGGEPRQPGSTGGEIRLLRQVMGVDQLTRYERRDVAGRPARLVAVGQVGPDFYSFEDPYVVASGSVGSKPVLSPDFLTLTISPAGDVGDRKVPNRRYLGLGEGLMFDGVSDRVNCVTMMPASGTVLCRAYVSRSWTGRVALMSNRSITLHLSDYDTGKFEVSYFRAPDDNADVFGPPIGSVERFYWFAFQWGGDGSVKLWVDEECVVLEEAGAISQSMAQAWTLGDWWLGNAGYRGVAGHWAWFDSVVEPNDLKSMMRGPLRGDEDGLVLFYPGESLGPVLFDGAATNQDNPQNAAIVGATAATLLEGGAELHGKDRPVTLGCCTNVLSIPIDPGRNIHSFGDDLQGIARVFDRQVLIPVEQVFDDLVDFLAATPSDGLCVTFPFLGLVKFFGLGEGSVVTADILGESLHPFAVHLPPGEWLDFGTGVNQFFTQDFAFEFWFSLSDLDAFPQTLFTNGDFTIALERSGDGPYARSFVVCSLSLDQSLVRCTAEVFQDEPYHLRFEVFQSGPIQADLYLNGSKASTDLAIQDSFKPAALAPFEAGRAVGGLANVGAGLYFSSIRLWSFAGGEMELRKWVFQVPDFDEANLVAMWNRPGPPSLGRVLVDDVGGLDAAISPGGLWSPGVTAGWPLAALVRALTRYAGFDITGLELEAAWAIDSSGISERWDTETSAWEAMTRIRETVNAYTLPTRGGLVRIGQVVSPEDAPGDGVVVEPWEIASVEVGETTRPPERWVTSYGRVYYRQVGAEVAAAADPERRRLVSEVQRFAEASHANNALRFPPGRTETTTGSFCRRAPAQIEVTRQRDMRFERMVLSTLEMTSGLRKEGAGLVLQVNHPDLPGGSTRALLVMKTDDVKTETWKIWGRW